MGDKKERLITVSNRLPISIKRKGKGLQYTESLGGLATGLSSVYKKYDGTWIGWPGLLSEKLGNQENEIRERLSREGCRPIFLSQGDIKNHYRGFCNGIIWPLFHYFTQHPKYDKGLWSSYKRINRIFCNEVLKVAKPGDNIWIHDYHLMLLPAMLREALPDAKIGFFLHIPFPSFEVFRLLPWRREILEGILGSDLIGFHTYDYVHNFLESVQHVLGHEHSLNRIQLDKRQAKVDIFPMGIDYEKFSSAAKSKDVISEVERIRNMVKGRKIIFSIDRLDYSKGILHRLDAYDAFLDRYPEYRDKVTFILVTVPSRTHVEQYRQLKKKLDERIGYIEGKHGRIGWMPVSYIFSSIPFSTLVALYNTADVSLITPLRDGMNLIAKEFLASKPDGKGVLVLSEMAGAASELVEALIVNPNDKAMVADALKSALEMPVDEQIERNRVMQERLKRYDINRWANDFLLRLSESVSSREEFLVPRLTSDGRETLLSDYHNSSRSLLLLDYDGTLVPFSKKPQQASPDREVISLLRNISQKKLCDVVLISGRQKNVLDKWFSEIPLNLVAEHGAWSKRWDGDWGGVRLPMGGWRGSILPVMEFYRDRTPGAKIEEKDFSLVWHYREVNPKLAMVRNAELKNAIMGMTRNLSLGIMEGNRIIEVMDSGINKGAAALKWMGDTNYDFILALGDDRTDEDIFEQLPESAYTIKVGPGSSKARFSLPSVDDARNLLKELTGD